MECLKFTHSTTARSPGVDLHEGIWSVIPAVDGLS